MGLAVLAATGRVRQRNVLPADRDALDRMRIRPLNPAPVDLAVMADGLEPLALHYAAAGSTPRSSGACSRPSTPPGPTAAVLGGLSTAADGGIFDFGDAPFFCSSGAVHLNRPVVGLAGT